MEASHEQKPKWLPQPRYQYESVKIDKPFSSNDISQKDVTTFNIPDNCWVYEYIKFAKKIRDSSAQSKCKKPCPIHTRQPQRTYSETRSVETQTSRSSLMLHTDEMETGQLAKKNWKCQCKQIEPISFVDLNRQHMEYEKLGIEITTEQMVSMNVLDRIRTTSSRHSFHTSGQQNQPNDRIQTAQRAFGAESYDSCRRDTQQPSFFVPKVSQMHSSSSGEQSEAPPKRSFYKRNKETNKCSDRNDKRSSDWYGTRGRRSQSLSSEQPSAKWKPTYAIEHNNRKISMPDAKKKTSNAAISVNTFNNKFGQSPCCYCNCCNNPNSNDISDYRNNDASSDSVLNAPMPDARARIKNITAAQRKNSKNNDDDGATAGSSASSETVVTLFKRSVFGRETPSSLELYSSDTLTDVWHIEGMLEGRNHSEMQISRLRGGLWSRTNSPDGQCRKTVNKSASIQSLPSTTRDGKEQRKSDTTIRLMQLREYQRLADSNFKRILKQSNELRLRDINTVEVDSRYCKCPMGMASCPLFLSHRLLAHFVNHHMAEPGIELREIHESDRLLLLFNANEYPLGKNACMSIMAYGGFRDHPETRPVFRYMPVRNFGLSNEIEKFSGHLPMLLMICRTTRAVIEQSFCNKKQVHFADDRYRQIVSDEDEELVVLWVATIELPEPIYVMMTVFNKNMAATRTAFMKTRSLFQSHDVNDVINQDFNHMILPDADLIILSNFDDDPIYLELSIREYGANYPFLYPYKSEI